MVARPIDIKDAPMFTEELRGAILEGARAGLYSAAQRMVQHIQTEVIPSVEPQPVDRGTYRAGWRAERDADGATIVNTTPQAGPIEYGVRAANVKVGRKLITAIADWAVRKGIASRQNSHRLAWAIATAMAASVKVTRGGTVKIVPGGGRGIFNGGKGLRIMEKANRELPKFIREEVAREVEKALFR